MASMAIENDLAQRVRDNWLRLSEEEKARLLPVLMTSINAWHGWSLNEAGRLRWLERQFKKAGIPFYPTS